MKQDHDDSPGRSGSYDPQDTPSYRYSGRYSGRYAARGGDADLGLLWSALP